MRVVVEIFDEPDGRVTTAFHTEGEEHDRSGALALKYMIIDLINSLDETEEHTIH